MHLPINVKSPNNISKWQVGFNSAFKGLIWLKRSACRIAKARIQAHTHNNDYLLVFYGNDSYAKAPMPYACIPCLVNSYELFSGKILRMYLLLLWTEEHSRYSDWLRAGRSGNGIPVGARFSEIFHTGPGAQPTSCKMGTGSFPEVKSGRGVTLTPHPLLVPWS
jgi:hypothetical protein